MKKHKWSETGAEHGQYIQNKPLSCMQYLPSTHLSVAALKMYIGPFS